jgi:hypothetical protein
MPHEWQRVQVINIETTKSTSITIEQFLFNMTRISFEEIL